MKNTNTFCLLSKEPEITIVGIQNNKENSCYVNVIIQALFHFENFKNTLISEVFDPANPSIKVLIELQKIIKCYDQYAKDKSIKKTKILDSLPLRKVLASAFEKERMYNLYETGDPIELLNHLLKAYHSYLTNKDCSDIFMVDPPDCKAKCLIHEMFQLNLTELTECSTCKIANKMNYDQNLFSFVLYTKEILRYIKVNPLPFNEIKEKMLINSKLVRAQESFQCDKCKKKINKKLVCRYIGQYLILNFAWTDDHKVKMEHIIKIYYMIPLYTMCLNIFSCYETTSHVYYEIFGLILYFLHHYVCVFKEKDKWIFYDDSVGTIIDSWEELVTYLIKNHYRPVGILYNKINEEQWGKKVTSQLTIQGMNKEIEFYKLVEEQKIKKLEEDNRLRLKEEQKNKKLEEDNRLRLKEEQKNKKLEDDNRRRLKEEQNNKKLEDDNKKLEQKNKKLEDDNRRRLIEQQNNKKLEDDNRLRLKEEQNRKEKEISSAQAQSDKLDKNVWKCPNCDSINNKINKMCSKCYEKDISEIEKGKVREYKKEDNQNNKKQITNNRADKDISKIEKGKASENKNEDNQNNKKQITNKGSDKDISKIEKSKASENKKEDNQNNKKQILNNGSDKEKEIIDGIKPYQQICSNNMNGKNINKKPNNECNNNNDINNLSDAKIAKTNKTLNNNTNQDMIFSQQKCPKCSGLILKSESQCSKCNIPKNKIELEKDKSNKNISANKLTEVNGKTIPMIASNSNSSVKEASDKKVQPDLKNKWICSICNKENNCISNLCIVCAKGKKISGIINAIENKKQPDPYNKIKENEWICLKCQTKNTLVTHICSKCYDKNIDVLSLIKSNEVTNKENTKVITNNKSQTVNNMKPIINNNNIYSGKANPFQPDEWDCNLCTTKNKFTSPYCSTCDQINQIVQDIIVQKSLANRGQLDINNCKRLSSNPPVNRGKSDLNSFNINNSNLISEFWKCLDCNKTITKETLYCISCEMKKKQTICPICSTEIKEGFTCSKCIPKATEVKNQNFKNMKSNIALYSRVDNTSLSNYGYSKQENQKYLMRPPTPTKGIISHSNKKSSENKSIEPDNLSNDYLNPSLQYMNSPNLLNYQKKYYSPNDNDLPQSHSIQSGKLPKRTLIKR